MQKNCYDVCFFDINAGKNVITGLRCSVTTFYCIKVLRHNNNDDKLIMVQSYFLFLRIFTFSATMNVVVVS